MTVHTHHNRDNQTNNQINKRCSHGMLDRQCGICKSRLVEDKSNKAFDKLWKRIEEADFKRATEGSNVIYSSEKKSNKKTKDVAPHDDNSVSRSELHKLSLPESAMRFYKPDIMARIQRTFPDFTPTKFGNYIKIGLVSSTGREWNGAIGKNYWDAKDCSGTVAKVLEVLKDPTLYTKANRQYREARGYSFVTKHKLYKQLSENLSGLPSKNDIDRLEKKIDEIIALLKSATVIGLTK